MQLVTFGAKAIFNGEGIEDTKAMKSLVICDDKVIYDVKAIFGRNLIKDCEAIRNIKISMAFLIKIKNFLKFFSRLYSILNLVFFTYYRLFLSELQKQEISFFYNQSIFESAGSEDT